MEIESQFYKIPSALRKRYYAAYNEIEAYRRTGYEMREKVRQNPVRNGHLVTREMHPVEVLILRKLCPEISSKDPKERLKGYKWICNQEWGKDFRASPYDKRYF